MFGNGKAKEWTLIANHADKSLIRNYLSYSMAEVFSEEMPYTTTTQFVELYLNDEYLGVYLVCEQNETGKNRVDIDDEYSNEADISYFIELWDTWANSPEIVVLKTWEEQVDFLDKWLDDSLTYMLSQYCE